MKRPLSAKHRHIGPWQRLSNDISDLKSMRYNQEQQREQSLSKKIQAFKPELIPYNIARVIPKKMSQDKERMYSQMLQLKQKINELTSENMKMKTRINILEKDNQKLGKMLQSVQNQSSSGTTVYINKSSQEKDKVNALINNYKKLIWEGKQHNEYLKNQNTEIRKTLKYTKANQLEIERKMLMEENRRLSLHLQEEHTRNKADKNFEKQLKELRNYLEEEVQNNKQLTVGNQNCIHFINQLELKANKERQKTEEKEKKLYRELNLIRKRWTEQTKKSDSLRAQLKCLQASQSTKSHCKHISPSNKRPASSNYYKKQGSVITNQTKQLQKSKEMKSFINTEHSQGHRKTSENNNKKSKQSIQRDQVLKTKESKAVIAFISEQDHEQSDIPFLLENIAKDPKEEQNRQKDRQIYHKSIQGEKSPIKERKLKISPENQAQGPAFVIKNDYNYNQNEGFEEQLQINDRKTNGTNKSPQDHLTNYKPNIQSTEIPTFKNSPHSEQQSTANVRQKLKHSVYEQEYCEDQDFYDPSCISAKNIYQNSDSQLQNKSISAEQKAKAQLYTDHPQFSIQRDTPNIKANGKNRKDDKSNSYDNKNMYECKHDPINLIIQDGPLNKKAYQTNNFKGHADFLIEELHNKEKKSKVPQYDEFDQLPNFQLQAGPSQLNLSMGISNYSYTDQQIISDDVKV